MRPHFVELDLSREVDRIAKFKFSLSRSCKYGAAPSAGDSLSFLPQRMSVDDCHCRKNA